MPRAPGKHKQDLQRSITLRYALRHEDQRGYTPGGVRGGFQGTT